LLSAKRDFFAQPAAKRAAENTPLHVANSPDFEPASETDAVGMMNPQPLHCSLLLLNFLK